MTQKAVRTDLALLYANVLESTQSCDGYHGSMV